MTDQPAERSVEDTEQLRALMRQFGRTRYGGLAQTELGRFVQAVNGGEPTHVALGIALEFLVKVNDAVAAGERRAAETQSRYNALNGDVQAMRRVLGSVGEVASGA